MSLSLSGCGTIALKHSFEDYSDTYAETQNRQMLENLARLSEREPIYFFQLAQISAGYTFTETASVGDTHERGLTNVPGGTTSNGVTTPFVAQGPMTNFRLANAAIGGTATHNPVFTLVPLGGDKFATQLLAPIKPAIFYELFEEGWPVDLLMRVLIERIELVSDNPNALKSSEKGAGESLEILVNRPSQADEGHYDRFLRACAMAREFQKAGILYLDISDRFEPLAEKTGFPYPPSDQQLLSAEKDGLVWKQVPDATDSQDDPDLLKRLNDIAASGPKDVPESKASGGGQPEHASYSLNKGYWQLGRNIQQTLFKLNQAGADAAEAELENPSSVYAGNDDLGTKFTAVLKNGIGVTDTSTSKGSYNVRLVMRSLLGAMLAVANEQRTFQYFDEFRTSQNALDAVRNVKELKVEIANLKKLSAVVDAEAEQKLAYDQAALRVQLGKAFDNVPESEDHPVLMMNWPARGPSVDLMPIDPATKVVSVDYKGKQYIIGDKTGLFLDNKHKDDPTLDTWNRDVFRLLVQLSLQVTADPSNFALPSLLQSH